MALFPAYRPKPDPLDASKKKDESLGWLHNQSCPPELAVVDVPVSQKNNSPTPHGSESSIRSFEAQIETISKYGIENREEQSKTPKKKFKKKKSKSHKSKHSASRSRSPSLSRKKVKKHKHKRRHGKSSSDENSDSDCQPSEKLQYNESMKIPTHDGLSKGIFVEGPIWFTSPLESMYFDRKPDKNNSIFCTTHYSQIAHYSRLSTLPLGSIHLSKLKTKNSKKTKNIRYFSKSARVAVSHDAVLIRSLPTENVAVNSENVPINSDHVSVNLEHIPVNSKYVPLNLTHREEKEVKEKIVETNSKVNSLKILDSATEHYLLGRENPPEVIPPSVEDNSERKYWQEQIKSFNERLAKEPHNVSLWLEFVSIQDKAIAYIFDNVDLSRTSNKKNVKLLTERKISVLEAAINKNIRELKLHLMRLKLGEDIWNNDKLLLEWNKLINNFPNDMNMWFQYLVFHQTYFSVFHLQKSVLAFEKCSERLIRMQGGTFLSHKVPDNIGYILIDVVTHLASLWYQSGYMERSIALFQALLEINLFCPKHLHGDTFDPESKIDMFEAFWDSKAPRFGEKDSIGWEKFMERREPVVFPEEILEGTQDEEDKILLEGGSKHELWLQLESSRDTNHWLPWQQDPETCEDMDREISFSVIRKFLFFTSSSGETFYLILRLLKFLGVKINSDRIVEQFDSYVVDPLLNQFDSCVIDPLRLESLQMVITGDEMQENIFDFPVIGPSIQKVECEAYFDFICEIITRSMDVVLASQKPVLVSVLIQVFTERCLIMKQRRRDLFQPLVKSCKKNIKSLLKQEQFRNNLDIYYSYAMFELHIGSQEEAIKIHKMALTFGIESCDILSGSDTSLALLKHLLALFRMDLERGLNVSTFLGAICSLLFERKFSYSEGTPNGAQILKVKKKLNSNVELLLYGLKNCLDSKNKLLNYCVILLSLVQLLTVGFKPACLVFEEFIARIKLFVSENAEIPRKVFHNVQERVYEDYLWLIDVAPRLKQLSSCLPMPPLLVRKILNDAISVAPTNVFFLEKFAKYQNWRDILCGSNFLQTNDSHILTIVFRVIPHIKKVVKMVESAEIGDVSSGHQLESILQSAVTLTAGKNCPLLWRLYLRLVQTLRPNQLKSVAYRALDSCPFAKCLYMDCIKLVPETMSDILRLMGEKGIRVRLPLEELDVLLEEEKEGSEDEHEECVKEEKEGNIEEKEENENENQKYQGES